MIQLRVHQSEVTFGTALSPPVPALVDSPGKIASILVSHLDKFGVSLSDITVDDGLLEDRGLSCEVQELEASVLLRADRVEIRFSSIEDTEGEIASTVVQEIGRLVTVVSPDVIARSHSVLFEIDCEALRSTYRGVLEKFCQPPGSFPKDTETAIVYYLPGDGEKGFLDSSLVLNRSAEVDGGVFREATLVFEGKALGLEGVIPAARARLTELLKKLDVVLLQDGEK